MQKQQTFIVNETNKLLDYIINIKKDLSKKKIKQYLKYNMILVNDKIITNANYIVNSNDKITINYNKNINTFPLEILYEDKDIIAINKPSGLLSISNDKEKEITAFKLVREYVKSNNPKTFLFVIHRLDQETSGVLMFAKNEKTKFLFQNNWNNIVKKRLYIAIVEGKIKLSGRFHSFLKENKAGMVYSTKNKEGKEAITDYRVLKEKDNKSILEVNILTGRRNQIRVHLSENSHPIIGDKKYGSKIKSRLMLHAYLLELIDPRTNKLLTIKAKIPKEFEVNFDV